MKAIMSACGRFYSVNDWGTFADTDEGVIYSDNYENIEFYLNEAKETFPQYDWKIVTFELKKPKYDLHQGEYTVRIIYITFISTVLFICAVNQLVSMFK